LIHHYSQVLRLVRSPVFIISFDRGSWSACFLGATPTGHFWPQAHV
jgi:hypothetical protein